jgi:hypothetical protein
VCGGCDAGDEGLPAACCEGRGWSVVASVGKWWTGRLADKAMGQPEGARPPGGLMQVNQCAAAWVVRDVEGAASRTCGMLGMSGDVTLDIQWCQYGAVVCWLWSGGERCKLMCTCSMWGSRASTYRQRCAGLVTLCFEDEALRYACCCNVVGGLLSECFTFLRVYSFGV